MKRRHFSKIIGVILLVLHLPLSPHLSSAKEPTNPAAAAVGSHIMLTPREMIWGGGDHVRTTVIEGDLKAANVLYTFRTKLPDRFMIPPHFHPADEHITVISGTFNMGMGDRFDRRKTKAMTAGSFIVMPKGTHHFAWTKGETIIQVHAIGPWGLTFVNPQDRPGIMKTGMP
jgi:quercetin dioxygenase-like cupin family protein